MEVQDISTVAAAERYLQGRLASTGLLLKRVESSYQNKEAVAVSPYPH